MTRRERLEAKLEKRREWAEKRRATGEALVSRGDKYRGDVAFNTQPGHIPERARIIAAQERGFENLDVAKHHDQKAAGLANQLDRTIFSDDENAVAELEARIAQLEEQRAYHVRVNKAWRASVTKSCKRLGGPCKPEDTDGRLIYLFNTDVITQAQANQIRRSMAVQHWHKDPFPAYVNANLGNRIRADRERIKTIQERAEKIAAAAAAPNGVTVKVYPESYGIAYAVVTFAEKPPRETIDALKAAGFSWSNGSWSGDSAKLPEGVKP